jgi:hypothetical protein
MDVPLYISTRRATEELVAAGHTQRMARRLLDAGLAGEPLRSSRDVAYDVERVVALALREQVTRAEVDRACPSGLFVARRLDDVAGPWDFSYPWAAYLRTTIESSGPFPLVVAISSVVVRGADIEEVRPSREGHYTLRLADPGPWFTVFRDRRCPTGPGRPWALHVPFLPRVGESAA